MSVGGEVEGARCWHETGPHFAPALYLFRLPDERLEPSQRARSQRFIVPGCLRKLQRNIGSILREALPALEKIPIALRRFPGRKR